MTPACPGTNRRGSGDRIIGTPRTARLGHPWPRIQRVILETRWDATRWPTAKRELRNALDERRRIARAGGFN